MQVEPANLGVSSKTAIKMDDDKYVGRYKHLGICQ